MSSQQQQIVNVVAAQRVSHKLVLDSQQQQKREQQQQKILEQIQKKKQQKRQRRQQAQRLQRQKLKIQQEKQKVYEKPQKMFQQDSDDGYQYKRVVKKIKRMFPQVAEKYDHYGKYKKNDFIVNDVDDDDQESSGSDDSNSNEESEGSHKKNDKNKKKQRKQSQKKQKRHQKKPEKVQKKHVEKNHQPVIKKQKIKIQPKTTSQKKENLVKEVSIRWWYALPEWPSADFDYKGKLKQLGYRIVDANQWKSQNDVIDGLQKALPIDGYRGVYKTKTKIIDVRPKQTVPSINNFRNKSIEQLTSILKKALQVQIEQLKTVKYEQQGEKQLLSDLQRQLSRLK